MSRLLTRNAEGGWFSFAEYGAEAVGLGLRRFVFLDQPLKLTAETSKL